MLWVLDEYWLSNPQVGLQRGQILKDNMLKIVGMFMKKAVRKGMNPDETNRILDQLVRTV
mgnify:FL=1